MKGFVEESFIKLKRDQIPIAAGSDNHVEVLSEDQVEKLLFYIEEVNKMTIRNKQITPVMNGLYHTYKWIA